MNAGVAETTDLALDKNKIAFGDFDLTRVSIYTQ